MPERGQAASGTGPLQAGRGSGPSGATLTLDYIMILLHHVTLPNLLGHVTPSLSRRLLNA